VQNGKREVILMAIKVKLSDKDTKKIIDKALAFDKKFGLKPIKKKKNK
jgi:hypothetical protein